MSVHTRIVLRTLCVFNALTLTTLGAASLYFVNGGPGPILAGCFWLAAGALFGLSHWLGKGTEWG